MFNLEKYIHKLHYRTFEKIWPHVHEEHPEITEEQVKEVIRNFVKDPPKLNQKKYFNKIFSDHPHAWMMDLLDNQGKYNKYKQLQDDIIKESEKEESKRTYPKFWYIFININTRFAVAYPLNDKSSRDIIEVLRNFISEHKCVSLTSDKESAFIAKETVKFLTDNNISQFIVLDEKHTSLSIIDSFIRHLRDRNTTNEKSHY